MKAWRRGRVGSALWTLVALLLAGAALPSTVAASRAEESVAGRSEDSMPGRPESDAPPRLEEGSATVPLRLYTDAEGRSCRVYERRVVIDGGAATALATVCRDANGRWVLSR